jgi:Tol biopolymer transport system component
MLAFICFFMLLSVAGAFWLAKRHASSPLGFPELKLQPLTANSRENAVTAGALSPDGKYLAYADAKGLHIKLIETGETREIAQPESLKGMQVSWNIASNWARNGTRIIATANVVGKPPSIWAVPMMGGAPRKIRDAATSASVSRDGSWVAFTTNLGPIGIDRDIWKMSPEGEHAQKLFETAGNTGFDGTEWSPDGQRLLYLLHRQQGENFEFSLESRDMQDRPAARIMPTWVWDYAWSPDGRLIYSSRQPGPIGGNCEYWAVRLDGRTGRPVEEPKRLTQGAGFCMDGSSISADGKRLSFRKWMWQGSVYVADLEAGGARITVPQRLTLDEGRNYPAAWTPDSKAVIFGSYRDGQWALFKQALGADKAEPIATLADSKSLSDYGLDDLWSAGARVSPDGAWLLYLAAPQEIVSPSSPALAPSRLMRVPIAGGAAELVLTARTWHRPACALPPGSLCVIGERTPDRKQLIFTAFDPLKGRGRELARFDIDPLASYPGDYFWDLSPDGASIAILRSSEPTIHLLSLGRAASRVIVVKGWNGFQKVNWAPDGKALIVSSATEQDAVLLRVDLGGRAYLLWKHEGGLDPAISRSDAPWGLPSPDGHHLAIYDGTTSGNIWMMENF